MIVNGVSQTYLPLGDRAIQYGDGCFTTMAYVDGHLEFYERHVARLKKACDVLGITFDAWAGVGESVAQALSEHYALSATNDSDKNQSGRDCVVKILISRGAGGRGYSPAGCDSPIYIVSLHPMPAHYANWQDQGIQLGTSSVQLAKQPLLAGIKHLNRLEQILVKAELDSSPYVDALVCDTDHHVIETSVGNIFWQDKGVWFTPSLDASGVAGVCREQVLELFKRTTVEVKQVKYTIDQLLSVEQMFVCNSLMKIVPVTAINLPNQQPIDLPVTDQIRHMQIALNVAAKQSQQGHQ